MCTDTLKISNGNRTEWSPIQSVIAFVKERFHNAVEIDILGIFEGYSSLQIWPPQNNFSGAKLFRANDVISIKHVLCT